MPLHGQHGFIFIIMHERQGESFQERRTFEAQPIPIFESKELNQLATYKRVDFIRNGEENLRDLINKTTDPIGKKSVMIHIMGAPGSGKSYIRRLVESHFSKNSKDGKPIAVHTLSWDRVEAELITRRNQDAAIFTPDDPNEPFKDTQLQIINAYFNSLLSYSMGGLDLKTAFRTVQDLLDHNPSFKPESGETVQNFERRCYNVFKRLIRKNNLDTMSLSSVLLVEQPGATALKHPIQGWQAPKREYTTRTLDDVLHQRDIFAEINRDTWYIAAIGAVGGPNMEAYDYYRDELKAARSLEEANIINEDYGLETFSTNSQWYAARTGATRKQARQARLAMWESLKEFTVSRSEYRQANDSPLPFSLNLGIKHPLWILDQSLIEILALSLPGELEKERFSALRSTAKLLIEKYKNYHPTEATWMMSMIFNVGIAAILENNISGLHEKNPQRRPDATAIVLSNPPFPKNDKID